MNAVRRLGTSLLTMVLGGVLLCACSSIQATSSASLIGHPSASLSQAFTSLGCTQSTTTTCVALAPGDTQVPSSSAELFINGHWKTVTTPATSWLTIDGTSCWDTGCLSVGSQWSSNVLWTTTLASASIVSDQATALSDVPLGVACYGQGTCLVFERTASNQLETAVSTDGGTNLSTPTASTVSATGLDGASCTPAGTCLVALSDNGALSMFTTSTNGANWAPVTLPSQWSNLSDLSCANARCVAVVVSAGATQLAIFHHGWQTLSLPQRTTAVGCLTTKKLTCVITGESNAHHVVASLLVRKQDESTTVRYFPTEVTGIACGASTCAVMGATTLTSEKP